MQFTKKQKVAAALGAGAVAVAGGGVAFAYWSSSGQGTGSATTGTSTAFAVSSTAVTAGDLVPNTSIGSVGGKVDTVNFTVKNNGTGAEQLRQIVVSVAGSTGTSPNATSTTYTHTDANSDPACTKGDFSVGGAAVGNSFTINSGNDSNLPADLAPGATYSGSVSLQMVDNGLNQDSCQGQTIPLFFAAS